MEIEPFGHVSLGPRLESVGLRWLRRLVLWGAVCLCTNMYVGVYIPCVGMTVNICKCHTMSTMFTPQVRFHWGPQTSQNTLTDWTQHPNTPCSLARSSPLPSSYTLPKSKAVTLGRLFVGAAQAKKNTRGVCGPVWQQSEQKTITIQPMNPFNTSTVWSKPVFPVLPHCPDLLTPSITLSACPTAAVLLKLK